MLWETAGPARFLDRVEQAVRQGDQVVLRLPRHAAPGLDWALRRRLDNLLCWLDLTADVTDPTPQVFLERWTTPTRSFSPDSPAELACCDGFSCYLVWIDISEPVLAREWLAFQDQYRAASLGRAPAQRSVFVLCLRGDAALLDESAEAGLTILRWAAVMSRLDSLLLAARSVPFDIGASRAELHARLAAEMGLFDPELCQELARSALSVLLQPGEFLRDYAAKRGWFQETPLAWNEGTEDTVDQASTAHSALLAVTRSEEVAVRIWRAQVAVLLPFLEDQRRLMLPLLRRWLRLPTLSADGRILSRAEDLELGALWAQICSNPSSDPRVREKLSLLRETRNQLSHLKPVSYDLIARLLTAR